MTSGRRVLAPGAWGAPAARGLLGTVFVPFLVARVLVGGALALARSLVDQLGADPAPPEAAAGLLGWDAAFYRDIAAGGYDAVADEGLRFFPLVPLLARAVALVPSVDADLGLVLVANLSALAFTVVLARLAWRERRDEAFTRRAVWLACVAPPAFVLVMGYAEATFMLLATVGLLALRARRWWVAALAGFLAGLTRPVALLLAVPALVEAVRDRRALLPRDVVARAAAVVAPFAGVGAYVAWATGRVNETLYPLRVQDDAARRGSWRAPPVTLVDTARDLLSGDQWSAALHLGTAIVMLALLVVLARRWPASYTWYAAAALLLGLSASNLDSLERYALSTVPFLLAAADVTEGTVREVTAMALAGAGLLAFALLSFTGVMVP